MTGPPNMIISPMYTTSIHNKSMMITASITNEKIEKTVETKALLDSGAGGDFIDREFAKEMQLEERK